MVVITSDHDQETQVQMASDGVMLGHCQEASDNTESFKHKEREKECSGRLGVHQ